MILIFLLGDREKIPNFSTSKLNCEVLYDDLAFEVRWAVAGESVVIQLVAKLEDSEYMSFGLSGDDKHSQMVGSDVTVAWVDKATLKGYAYDYYLDAKSQCAGTRGSCPDERLADETNSVRLLNAAMVNGYSIVTYQRPLKAADELDRAVKSDKEQPIVWAIGPLNSRQEVSYHTHFTKGDRYLDFGRAPAWNCPMPEMDESGMEDLKPKSSSKKPSRGGNGQYLVETSVGDNNGKNKYASDDYDSDISETGNTKSQDTRRSGQVVPTPKPAPRDDAWEIPPVNCNEPDDGVFYAQMGPTGGKHGYSAITGHVGWGISWYINGLLIPEINVVRGKTYTFVTEGGYDPEIPARYHPFYITDDPIGGYEHKTEEERSRVKIFAGVQEADNGDLIPTGVGRLCNWTPDSNGPPADEFASFGAYQRTLTLRCDPGEPGIVTWTPDRRTPDTVYYQCFTHRYLGWKINVLDSCDVTGEESQKHEVYEPYETDVEEEEDDAKEPGDLISRPSIRINTKVKPDSNFLAEQNKDNKDLNTESKDDILTGEVISDVKKVSPESNPRPDYDFPLTKSQFKEVLDSVEKYESSMKVSQKDMFENRPVYYHSTPSPHHHHLSAKNDHLMYNIPERPLRVNEDGKINPQIGLPNNHQPMTLQTFMRPQGKPMMGPNMFFRRPPPPAEMRIRRPGMPKPIIGVPPRLPPPSYMMGQQMMASQKKHFFKMPPTNRQPINSMNMGRPPMMMAVKNSINGNPKPMYPVIHTPPNKSPSQTVIMGKPNLIAQTLTLGQPTIIGQPQIKGPISLPPPQLSDSVFQQSITNTYLNKPGQIIMGKPMDNPLPLDQQMIPTKHQVQYTTVHRTSTVDNNHSPNHKYDTVKPVYEIESPQSSLKSNITPSELLKNTTNPNENLITMKPAVNTGFKPDSVVIEGGFKPIIREPLLSGQDRITDFDTEEEEENRRHDTVDSEQVEDSVPQLGNFYEKQMTESFEPMFIPSPPDRFQGINLTSFSEKSKLSHVDIGPRPVYIKPQVKSDNNERKPVDDMTTAADRIDAYYLPPDTRKSNIPQQKPSDVKPPAGVVVSYDGQTISDKTLTGATAKNDGNKIYSAKLSSNSEILTKFPQFGPFKGEIPAELHAQLNNEKKLKTITNSHGLPSDIESTFKVPSRITKLSLVSAIEESDEFTDDDDTEQEASQIHKEIVEAPQKNENKEVVESKIVKRSVHNTDEQKDMSGNEGHDHSMHDHSQHDHSMHDHSQHDHSHHDHDHSDHNEKSSATTIHTIRKIITILPLMYLCKLLF